MLTRLIRDATIADAPGLARVHVDTWRAAYAGILPAEFLAGLSYEGREQRWRENLTDAAPGRFTLVAEEGGQVIGFAGGGPEHSGDVEYRGEVYALYVLPSRQRRGMGRQLLQACAHRLLAQGLESVLIWVLAANPARGFYEHLGGRPVRRQEIEIGGALLPEVAYGWLDTSALLAERDVPGAGEEGFEFRDPGRLADSELELVLVERHPPDPLRGWVPAYRFKMVLASQGQEVGQISLRVGDTHHIRMYAGHIGYGVEPQHRGRRYAARACRLLFGLARSHGLNPLWITCNPDNWASRRTCELAGGRLVEIVDLPDDIDMYQAGERQKCRYRIDL